MGTIIIIGPDVSQWHTNLDFHTRVLLMNDFHILLPLTDVFGFSNNNIMFHGPSIIQLVRGTLRNYFFPSSFNNRILLPF